MENWKPIPGFEQSHEVSDQGRIKSLARMRRVRGNYFAPMKERILEPYKNNLLYCVVHIGLNGKKFIKLVHRIIATAWIPNPENKKEINHKNGIRYDNRLENLEWCTRKENAIHAHRTGLQVIKSGAESHMSRPVLQFSKDGDFIKYFGNIKLASIETGVNLSSISAVCSKRKFRHTAGGFKWFYKEEVGQYYADRIAEAGDLYQEREHGNQ